LERDELMSSRGTRVAGCPVVCEFDGPMKATQVMATESPVASYRTD
jgi:hypothetical protein